MAAAVQCRGALPPAVGIPSVPTDADTAVLRRVHVDWTLGTGRVEPLIAARTVASIDNCTRYRRRMTAAIKCDSTLCDTARVVEKPCCTRTAILSRGKVGGTEATLRAIPLIAAGTVATSDTVARHSHCVIRTVCLGGAAQVAVRVRAKRRVGSRT